LSLIVLTCGVANAQQLLVNPDFETPPVLPDWDLAETITGMPGTSINSAQLQDFANQPNTIAGQTGIWLRGFEGNIGDFMGQNKMINAILSQTVPGMAGETYTFTGWSKFEQNFAGGVDNLNAGPPGNGAPSPTQTSMLLEFLDSGGAVLGSPVTLNVKADRAAKSDIAFPNDNVWYQHSLMGMAPAGTADVRVTASATDMVFNVDPGQSAFYDNFSLTAASEPSTEKLDNANLDEPLINAGWTLTQVPSGATTALFQNATFANHTGGGAGTGIWLRAFATANPEGGATVTQTVTGVPGGEYTLSAWSKWEANYSGGTAGPTETLLELTFLNANEMVIGTPVTLDLRTEQMNDNMWRQHTLMGTAPAETASVRVSGIARNMFTTMGAQSAFFDDFSLTLASAGVPGDYNGNGTVDAADYVLWRNGGALQNEVVTPGENTPEDYNAWRARFGNTGSGASGNLLVSAATVPEPSSGLVLLGLLAGAAAYRRGFK
jgi:hypothetical protein